MAAPAIASNLRSLIAAWIYEHLIVRRTLLLAILILCGSVLTTSMIIHPLPPRGSEYLPPVPLLTAYGAGIDYYQFWVVGRARKMVRLDNIYSAKDRLRVAELGRGMLLSSPHRSERVAGILQVRGHEIQTFSTPFLYAVVNVFASGQYESDYALFQNICLTCLVLSLVAMGWILRFSLIDSALIAGMTLLWNEPLASDLRVGNVNQLQLFGVAFYLLSRSQPERPWLEILSGLVLGFLVAFKPTLGMIPMLLTLAWVIDRRWTALLRQGTAAVAAAGIAFVIGCGFLDSWSAWSDWLSALADLEVVSNISVQSGNYSLAQVIREATSDSADSRVSPSLILSAVVLVLTAVALALTRSGALSAQDGGQARSDRDFLVTSLGCAASVVTLKLVWLHYYILLFPLSLYVLRPGGWIRPKIGAGGRPGLLLPTAVVALAFLAFLASFGWPLAVLFVSNSSTHADLCIGGAWGLMLLGLAGLWFPTPALSQATTSRK